MQADNSTRIEQVVIVQQGTQETPEAGASATVAEALPVGVAPPEPALHTAMDTSSHLQHATGLADSHISLPVSCPPGIDTTAAPALTPPTKATEPRSRFVQVGDIVILEVNGDKYTFLPVRQSGYVAPK